MNTRTAREHAEELAAGEWRRDEALAAEAERQTPFNGWENAMENAALQWKFIDGANWQAARDAEPTTVTAKQIEESAREFLRYTETASPDERSSATSWDRARRITRMILLAAEVRIEGDEA